MQMREERILKKMLHRKIVRLPTGRPRSRGIDQIRKDIEMRLGKWEAIQVNRKWEKERAGDRFLCNTLPI